MTGYHLPTPWRNVWMITRMPRGKRHLLIGALVAAGILAVPFHRAMTEGKAEPTRSGSKPDLKQKTTEGVSVAPLSPNLTPPGAEMVLVMIRSTLLTLNDALRTGNYTVLRDLAAPSFRERNTAGRLHQIFSSLSTRGIDLSAAAILAPKFPQAPSIDENKRLRISGYFPGDPVQINFDMSFEVVAGQWRLFGLSVNPLKPESLSTAPVGAAPTEASKPPHKNAKTTRPN